MSHSIFLVSVDQNDLTTGHLINPKKRCRFDTNYFDRVSLTINKKYLTRHHTLEFFCQSPSYRNVVSEMKKLVTKQTEDLYVYIREIHTCLGYSVLHGSIYSNKYDACEILYNRIPEISKIELTKRSVGCLNNDDLPLKPTIEFEINVSGDICYKETRVLDKDGKIMHNGQEYELNYEFLTYHTHGFCRSFDPTLKEVLAQIPEENVPQDEFMIQVNSVHALDMYHIGHSKIYTKVVKHQDKKRKVD